MEKPGPLGVLRLANRSLAARCAAAAAANGLTVERVQRTFTAVQNDQHPILSTGHDVIRFFHGGRLLSVFLRLATGFYRIGANRRLPNLLLRPRRPPWDSETEKSGRIKPLCVLARARYTDWANTVCIDVRRMHRSRSTACDGGLFWLHSSEFTVTALHADVEVPSF